MAETLKTLDQRQLPVAAVSLYTAPAGGSTIVKIMRIVNTDVGAPHSFALYQGGSASANQITGNIALDPSAEHVDGVGTILGAGQSIYGKADVAGVVTCTLAGMEITP